MKTAFIQVIVAVPLLLGGAGCGRNAPPPAAPPDPPPAKPLAVADPTLLAFADTFARFAQDCAASARDAAQEIAERTPSSPDKK